MGRVVGIDLGTTNTAVAVLLDGKPKVLEDERGYKVLPSCVSSKGDGRFIVGHAAHNLIITRPGRTVYATKRLIGRRFDSPEAVEARKHMQYQMREGPDGGVQVQLGDAWMTPTEVAAIMLQVIKSIAERALGDTVDTAIITVPAYFNHAQRQATIEAASMAGLKCERLLNEPTAAALAYGFKKTMNRTVLVFDLGGGTFDVSVLRIGDGLYETLATVGDTYLGGEDFDFRLVDHLAEQFKLKHGVDLRNDRHTLQRLKDAAERAKCELSFAERTQVQVPHVTPTENLDLTVSRATLESITADLLERCLQVSRKAVAEAGLEVRDIEEVILVGGQSRMPKLRDSVTRLFGREPSRSVHPEEAVAVGAAIHASSLDDPDAAPMVLLDVTPFDLGIDSAGGIFSPVIQRNARVPCSETRVFVTARDGQDTVKVVIRQGSSKVASENEFLGEFVMEGLTKAPRFQTKVEVSFRLDSNGILHVTAIEKGTGERRQVVIRNYTQRALEPKLPTPEEAAADREKRAREQVETAPVPAAPTAGAAKKAGLLSSLFGGRKAKPAKAATPTPAAEAAPSPIEPAPAIPQIDLSNIPMAPADPQEPTPVEATPIEEEEAPPAPLPDSRPASLGLAGEGSAADPFANRKSPEKQGFASDLNAREASALSADDLFGDMAGEDEEPVEEFATLDDVEESPEDFLNRMTSGDDALAGFLGGADEEPEPPAGFLGGLTEPEAAPAGFLGGPAEPEEAPAGFLGGPEEPAGFLGGPEEPAGFLGGPAKAGASMEDDLEALTERLAQELSGAGGWGEDAMFAASPDLADDPMFLAPPPTKAEEKPPLLSAAYPEEDDITPDAPLARGGTVSVPPPSSLGSDLDDLPDFDSLPPPVPAEPARKPARIKLNYRRFEVFVAEYRENLRRGGTFIKTDKPLPEGRACIFEVKVPGVAEPVIFDAQVSWVQDGSDGSDAGMGIEYRMDERQRYQIERLLKQTPTS